MIVSDEIMERAIKVVIEKVLIPKFDQLGMDSSGEWKRSLAPRKNELLGKSYTEYLVNGRKPGKRPPIRNIEKWVNNKLGISGKQATSIAFAISNTIAKEGTSWYKAGGSDLLDVLKSDEVTKIFKEQLGKEIRSTIVNQFKRNIKS
ncbi:MAG: hypothetical protein ACRCU6_06000 [Fusobacteriaceae bacterium]